MAFFWCDENTQEEGRDRRHIRSRLAFFSLHFFNTLVTCLYSRHLLVCFIFINKIIKVGISIYTWECSRRGSIYRLIISPRRKFDALQSSAKMRVSKNIKFPRGTYNNERFVKQYHILTSSLINYRTGARQHGIYLLDRDVFVAFYFKIHSAHSGGMTDV